MVGHGIGTGSCWTRLGRCSQRTRSDARGMAASNRPSRSVGAALLSSLALGALPALSAPVSWPLLPVTLSSPAPNAASSPAWHRAATNTSRPYSQTLGFQHSGFAPTVASTYSMLHDPSPPARSTARTQASPDAAPTWLRRSRNVVDPVSATATLRLVAV